MNVRKMKKWIAEHRKDPTVIQWLANNPPPRDWKGTKMEWAYAEFPYWFYNMCFRMTALVIEFLDK